MRVRSEVLASICAGVAGLCSIVVLGASAASAADKLVVGRSDATDFAFSALDVGTSAGIFAKNGIELQNVVFGGNRGQQALVSGDLDILLGSGSQLVLMAKGSTAKAVAQMAGPPLSIGILVRADSPLKVQDLKGKRIGVTTAISLTAWLATELSRVHGWGKDGVVLAPLGSTEGEIAALLSNNVEAIVTSIVAGHKLEEQGRAKVLANFADVKDYITHVIYANGDLAKNKPDVLRRFLKAWFETIAFMRDNKAKAIEISRKTTQLSPRLAEIVYDELMPMLNTDGHFNPKGIETMKRSFVELGQLDTAPDNKTLYTEEFLPKPSH
jgi:ABC-type nitrate/sulfonate/bicarbonate transport system substrate-binding protein